MRRAAAFGLVLLLLASPLAHAASPNFPPLTGRVVDAAHLLSPAATELLTQQLAAYEAQSTTQIVVVTVPNLQNLPIEEYGYRLGRFWGIGQKGKNNGAILLVAPQARKVRIEVGYGLEGTLTDARTSQIVQSIILPRFRQGNMEQGIVAGTAAIVTALGGQWSNATTAPTQPSTNGTADSGNAIVYFFIIFLLIFIFSRRRGRGIFFLPFIGFGGGSRGGNDDNFRGGGGGFGGGGSSGSW